MGVPAVIAFVGDSWTYLNKITSPMRVSLIAEHGDAGIGWVSPVNANYYAGVTVSRAGTWTDTAATTALGADYTHFNSTDTATPATLTVTATATKFVLHYIKQATGGDFTYAVDGGSATTVNTANASTAHATVEIDGLSSASHTLVVTVTNAGTAGVTLGGVDIQRENAGVRLHKLGRAGTTADQWGSLNETIWTANMTALAPDLAFVLLGVNDYLGDRSLLTFNDGLYEVVSRLQSVGADVVLVAPAITGDATGALPQTDYTSMMEGLAFSMGCGFIDLADSVPSYDTDPTAWDNATHVSVSGGQLAADAILEYINGL